MGGGTPLRLGVAGAAGAMGAATVQVILARRDLILAAVIDREQRRRAPLHGLARKIAGDALGDCDVIIEFSTGSAAAELASAAAAAGGPALVLGATGLSGADTAAIEAAARKVAIVKSGNYALGVNMLAGLVAQAARRLPAADWDIEIVEAHHRRKKDAPSGTALMLGEAAARGRGANLADLAEPARSDLGAARAPGGIGFASLRGGDIIGEHSVVFAAADEILTLSHSARDRRLFARGAVEAARWVVGRPPGLYGMNDVLGFSD